MSHNGHIQRETSLPRSYQTVKARIVDADVSMSDLARDSGISKATLSHIVNGRRRGDKHRRAIWSAFRSRSGLDVSFNEFWGTDVPAATQRTPA